MSLLTPALGQLQFTLKSRAKVIRTWHLRSGAITLVLIALAIISGIIRAGILPVNLHFWWRLFNSPWDAKGPEIIGNTIILHFIDRQRYDDITPGGIIFDDGAPGATAAVIPALSSIGMTIFLILLSFFACLMIWKRGLSTYKQDNIWCCLNELPCSKLRGI